MRQALVTGGGNGIGAAIAARLDAAGYAVAVLDLDADAAQTVAAGLSAGVALSADVRDVGSVDAALAALGKPVNLLVNNAGIVRFGPVVEQSVENFETVIGINLIGAYIVSRQVVASMTVGDHIISLTSINGRTPGPGSGAYPAAKAGLRQLMRQLSVELAERGIRANSISPGFIDAGMSAPIYADRAVRERRSKAVPSGRLGMAEDIANAVAFLDSDQGAYVNGHELVVDGGVVHSLLAHLPRE